MSHQDPEQVIQSRDPIRPTLQEAHHLLPSGSVDARSESEYDASLPKQKVNSARSRDLISDILATWWLEFLACALVILALFAIAITLALYQGRPLPNWPFHVSINSLVSTYTVILKTAALLIIAEGLSQLKWTWFGKSRPLHHITAFDEASRGPWGALVLLWTLRGRQVVAVIGSIITILALFVDPTTQALIHYYSCPVQVPGVSATIPRRNTFSETGLHAGAGFSSLTYEFESAINAGLFNPVSVPVASACPTGNCTFEHPYHSVAYCSTCTDISSQLNRKCNLRNNQSNSAANSSWASRTSYCNVTLPGRLVTLQGFYNNGTTLNQYLTLKSSFMDGTFDLIAANVTNIYSSSKRCTTAAENSTWACTGSGAATCRLYPCVRTYKAEITAGTLTEHQLSSSEEFTEDWSQMANTTVDIGCLSPSERKSLTDLGYTINETTKWVGYKGPGFFGNASRNTQPNLKLPNSTVPERCLYRMYLISSNSVGYFMDSYFNGSVTNLGSSYDYLTDGPVQLKKLLGSGRITFDSVQSTLGDIADSMTAYMRQSATHADSGRPALWNDTHPPTVGEVFETETCVGVRWPYFTVPAAVAGLTVVFLVSMISQTSSRTEKLDWKSSSLALLFHGLDPNVRDQIGPVDRVKDMEVVAKGLCVQLGRSEKGFKFSAPS